MKLSAVQVNEYKSIWDSNEFKVGHITCLVGKNEAGKTAILEALYRLNPLIDGEGQFNVDDDYPRSEVGAYQLAVKQSKRQHATVTTATFTLDDELIAIEKDFGIGALKKPALVLLLGYEGWKTKECRFKFRLELDEPKIVAHLVATCGVDADDVPLDASGKSPGTVEELSAVLAHHAKEKAAAVALATEAANALSADAERADAVLKAKAEGESAELKSLRELVGSVLSGGTVGREIYNRHLSGHVPKFMYFDQYNQMKGADNVEALIERKEAKTLEPADHPLLGLIAIANLQLDELVDHQRTLTLKNKLQGASKHLTREVLKYWSQNRHLEMHFDVRSAAPRDPEGMTEGTNIWGEVHDRKRGASTELSTRSAGFIWFFSFLAWYETLKSDGQRLVLLLDEPGTTLHGKAQEDLLRYFEENIASNPDHQLIYTTHSPFMVDPTHFERVRIVQDQGIDTDEELPRDQDGTKVFEEVLDANADSLFPLQGALGYGLNQTLFVGPNCLVVEGPSDLLYLQVLSSALESAGRTGLDADWTITPVGGVGNVPTFVALLGAQRDLNIVTLIDYQKSDQQKLENLYKRRLLEKSRLVTFADFTGSAEADVEDMFDDAFYIKLVAEEYGLKLTKTSLKSKHPRMTVRMSECFDSMSPPSGAPYNHYRPARRLADKGSSVKFSNKTLDRFEKAFIKVNSFL